VAVSASAACAKASSTVVPRPSMLMITATTAGRKPVV
jgi:hypothetical protein